MLEVVTTRVQSSGRLLHGPQLALVLAAGFILIGIAIPSVVGSKLLMTLMVQAAINALLATSVGALLRLNGVITFGHSAFFGLGSYIVALGIQKAGLSAELAIVLALVIPTALAFVLGLGIVGIPGVPFAMLTLAIGQALFELATKTRELTNGEDGFDFALPSRIFGLPGSLFQQPESMFMIGWVLLVVVILSLWVLTRSRFGRLVLAIRTNEERARFLGYTTRTPRAAVFALTAFIAALAGVLQVLYSAYTSPDALSALISGSALIMAIIGGPELVWGPACGAMLFFFFKDVVGDYTEHWQSLIGVILIVVTLTLPQGVGGLLHRYIHVLTDRRSK